jgi:hypothetical protein
MTGNGAHGLEGKIVSDAASFDLTQNHSLARTFIFIFLVLLSGDAQDEQQRDQGKYPVHDFFKKGRFLKLQKEVDSGNLEMIFVIKYKVELTYLGFILNSSNSSQI